ncbi:MAG: CCA tRNA nucleotidyltransferase [bacterium]|nr:CCA tRNA nucleotidyltransferase [bacterium]
MFVERPDLRDRTPAPVRELVDCVVAAGGRAWLVGGTVRDLILGEQPRDYDIATDQRPERIGQLIPAADLSAARFGTASVATDLGDVTLTTLRADGDYSNQRHPDAVEFLDDPELDARRRDFTCNALYLDPIAGRLLDPVGGIEDLEARRLRTIGGPVLRFREDPLRLLRAVRFAARFDFEFESATAAALNTVATELATLAPERAFAEFSDMFTAPGRGRALRLLVERGIADVLLPEVAAMDGVEQPPEYHPEGDVLTHVALVLDHVPAGDRELAWAAVLHDIGKPSTFQRAPDRIRFDGHDVLSAEMAEGVLRRLRAPRDLIDLVMEISRDHIRFAALPQMRPRRRERWLRTPNFARHLAFHRADCLGSHGKLEIHDFAARELASLPPARPALVRGQDVLELGVPPGPGVGRVLAAFEAAADEVPVAPDREAALVLLRETVTRLRQAGDLESR